MSATQHELERQRATLSLASAFGPLTGVITRGARDHGERVWVNVAALNRTVHIGPCKWQGRDHLALPERGDTCLVHFDEHDDPWVTAWWPLSLDIVAAARRALDHKTNYLYDQVRPIPNSLWVAPPVITDCSGFVTLCYKAARCLDPNGPAYNYNGQAYTGYLFANGTATASPRPGDLAFYGVNPPDTSAPDHVAVYIGNSNIISHGTTGDPTLRAADYRTDDVPGGFAAPYYMTYQLAR